MKILKLKTERRSLGNLGERRAALYLFLHGYRILERNYVSGDAEIDIIARRGKICAFVEVKTRTLGHESLKEPRPASSVTPEKQRKIIRCARDYRYKHPFSAKMRFDIIEVLVRDDGRKPKIQKIEHLISAFDADSARQV